MPGPAFSIRTIGAEAQPLVIVDDFAANPDALRTVATDTRFGPAAHHYPGLRAELPDGYWEAQRPVAAAALARIAGRPCEFALVDASFSLVTRDPAALTLRQRLPHCDAFAPDRIAMVHYLVPDGTDGTAFFRHRSTGFETIHETREREYGRRLDDELRSHPRPDGYAADSTVLFEQTAVVEGRYNRAIFYRSNLLHSGAIAMLARLSSDPAKGRMTITAFLQLI